MLRLFWLTATQQMPPSPSSVSIWIGCEFKLPPRISRMFHSRTHLSAPPETKNEPSGEKSKTGPVLNWTSIERSGCWREELRHSKTNPYGEETVCVSWWWWRRRYWPVICPSRLVDSSSAVALITEGKAVLNELRVCDRTGGVNWISLGTRRATALLSRSSSVDSKSSRRSYKEKIRWLESCGN